MSNKNKKVCATLNYIDHFPTLVFTVAICISISGFSSIVNISKRIMTSIVGLSICAIIAGIKKYKSIIKKKKTKHNEIACWKNHSRRHKRLNF